MIDPRTLVPLDIETLAASVRRTGRAVVAHEAVRSAGSAPSSRAQLQTAAFDCLEAPIQRVGAPFTPVPVSPPLEDAYRPGADQILRGGQARDRVGLAESDRWSCPRSGRRDGQCACSVRIGSSSPAAARSATRPGSRSSTSR